MIMENSCRVCKFCSRWSSGHYFCMNLPRSRRMSINEGIPDWCPLIKPKPTIIFPSKEEINTMADKNIVTRPPYLVYKTACNELMDKIKELNGL
jgi:hypothetical protein